MEYFRIIKVKTSEQYIQESLTLSNLEAISNNIFVIGDQSEKKADIGGIWGEFTLSRSNIKGGLRFALLECPNALCWTVTTGFPPDKESIIIHLTINRQETKQEFVEEIEEFLNDQSICLKRLFYNLA
jgi:hypothetical protein